MPQGSPVREALENGEFSGSEAKVRATLPTIEGLRDVSQFRAGAAIDPDVHRQNVLPDDGGKSGDQHQHSRQQDSSRR